MIGSEIDIFDFRDLNLLYILKINVIIMSDDKLNEVVSNDDLFDKNELLSDESSSEMTKKSNKKKAEPEVEMVKEEVDSEPIPSPAIEVDIEVEPVIEVKAEPKAKKEKKKSEPVVKVEVPKTQMERYADMLAGKNFEVRFKGKLIFDSASKIQYSLNDLGIVVSGKLYKYNEVIIRIKN